jgi:hypothetical protein
MDWLFKSGAFSIGLDRDQRRTHVLNMAYGSGFQSACEISLHVWYLVSLMIPQGPSLISVIVGFDFPVVFGYHIISTKAMRYVCP